ncbi:MAG: hypothetical protein ABI741_12820 [Ferruginibacter sp.]
MKKIFLINLFACSVLCLAFLYTGNVKTDCKLQCSSSKKNVKPKEPKISSGGETDDELFRFHKIYIKI